MSCTYENCIFGLSEVVPLPSNFKFCVIIIHHVYFHPSDDISMSISHGCIFQLFLGAKIKKNFYYFAVLFTFFLSILRAFLLRKGTSPHARSMVFPRKIWKHFFLPVLPRIIKIDNLMLIS